MNDDLSLKSINNPDQQGISSQVAMAKNKDRNKKEDTEIKEQSMNDSVPNEQDEGVNLPDADFSLLEEERQGVEEDSNVIHTSRHLDALKAEIEKFKAESEDNRDKYMRALAEFENFKKRSLKERAELLRYQGERVLLDVLEVVDNLELALQHAEADPKQLKEGLDLIYKRFIDILGKWEVKSESGMGKDFDPLKHSAISKVPADAKPGTIVNELKKAYFYKDKLLRVGEVVIADKPPEETLENSTIEPPNETLN